MTEPTSTKTGLRAVIRRELREWVSRPLYLLCMIIFPLFTFLFMLTLMDEGLPERLPIAVVDLDRSPASRNFIRQLNATNQSDVVQILNSYSEGRDAMQRGEIYGFIMIPERFEAKAMAGRQPEISFYTNDAYLIPGSLLYKNFKTMSVLASGAIVQQTLLAKGMPNYELMAKLQPITTDVHPLGNPWISYSVYLNNSFIPGVMQLMILLVTVFSIGTEIKHKRSRQWLATADDSILVAVIGKLLPQTLVFFLMGAFCQMLLYGYWHFPLHNHVGHMLLAMLLLVLASQSMGVIMMSIAPSLRIGLSMAGLFGIIAFSISAFSFPAPAMYAPFRVLTNIFPLRHYFLIYADQALNGIPIYYSRTEYMILILFIIASLPLLPRLERALQRQVYVP